MKHKKYLTTALSVCWVIALWGFSSSASARWYQVEVILFKYSDKNIADGEDWSEPERLANFATAVELLDNAPTVEDEAKYANAFVALPRSALKLRGVYERLRSAPGYEPIVHKGWRQPGYGANSVRQVYVAERPSGSVLDEPATNIVLPNSDIEWVEGTIGLQSGRLLHIGANFAYRGQGIATQIREFRRIKLKEIHYFDHPLFGVIVQVTPYRTVAEGVIEEPEDLP